MPGAIHSFKGAALVPSVVLGKLARKPRLQPAPPKDLRELDCQSIQSDGINAKIAGTKCLSLEEINLKRRCVW